MVSRHSPKTQPDSATTVLVVDDDAMMRSLIRRTLVAAGYGGLGPELVADVITVRPHTRVAYISSYEVAKLRAHGVDLR